MSDSESHFQAFNTILGGRLGKKNPSSSPNAARAASQPYEIDAPDEDDEAPSEESAGSRERRRRLEEERDDDISLIPDERRRSRAIYVGRSGDSDTGSAILSCTILSRGLQRVIRRLKTPVKHQSNRDLEGRHSRTPIIYNDLMVIEAPFHDLYFARAELTRRMKEEDRLLSREIVELLDFIKKYFKDTEAELEILRHRGVINHRLLWTMFPPGTLVYLRQPTLSRGLVYEQCIVVQSTGYTQTPQGKELFIDAKEWQFTGFDYHRIVSTTYIGEFRGVKTISAETLTHLPFASLSKDLQNEIKTRLIDRAKRYIELFARPASFWEYEGPAKVYSLVPNDMFSDLASTWATPNTFPGNRTIKERVVVTSRLMGYHYGYLVEDHASVPILDHSKPIDEEIYLTCSGYVSASLIDAEYQASRLIVSQLRPVCWEPNALHGAEVAGQETILNQVSKFSFKDQLPQPNVGGRRPNAGLVFWLKGPLVKNRSFARNMAENAEKPFVQRDLLSFLGGERENGPVIGIFDSLKITFDAQCVVFLENCGKLMERRLIDEPERAREITRFFDMLNFYPGIIFLSPGTVNDADPLFDELSVISV